MKGEFLKYGRGLSILVLNSYPQSAAHSLCFKLTVRVTFLTVAKSYPHTWGLTDPTLIEFECLINPMGSTYSVHVIWSLDLIFHVGVTFVLI